MFVTFSSADSPVLWLQMDPKLELLRQVTFEQPDYMWQYQLRFERDVVSQKEVKIRLILCFERISCS
jgi:transcription initiation factor TFIID subunit 2